MPKDASLNVRLDSDVKKAAEAVYAAFGLSLAEAVNVFIHKSINVGGLPFDLRPERPNAGTLAAIAEAEHISRDPTVKGYRDIDALLKDLKKDD